MVLLIELSPTHAVLEHITVLETVRVTLLTFKHLMPLKMTGRRPREATMNNRES